MTTTTLIIVWKVFIGSLPKIAAEEYIRNFKKNFESSVVLPDYVKCVYLPRPTNGFDDKTCESSVEMMPLNQAVNTNEIEDLVKGEKEQLVNVRISKIEKSLMLQRSKKLGFKNLSEYLRFVGLNSNIDVK